MKFFICSKDLSKAPLSLFKRNYPLKWEVVTTHFYVKSLLADNKIDKNKDFIVTTEGREFLYKSQFNNVISWQKFVSTYQMCHDTEIEDLVMKLGLSFLRNPVRNDFWLQKKNWLPKIKPLLELKLPDVSSYYEGPYICISVRKRSIETSHNTDLKMIKDFICYKSGLGQISEKFKIFITGPGSEELHDGKTVWQVNLEEWTALISKEPCEAVITTMDGPCQLARIWSKAKKFIQIDMENINWQANIDNPILLGSPQDFITSKMILYNSWVGAETLKTVISPTWAGDQTKKIKDKTTLIIDFITFRAKLGLGDGLIFSKIPRLAKQIGGYDKVFISTKNGPRHQDYWKLIWDLNPWVDGYIDQIGDQSCSADTFFTDFYKDANISINMIDRAIRAFKLYRGNEEPTPEIFYKPNLVEYYKDLIIWDPNYVTGCYGLTKNNVQKYFNSNNIKIDLQFESNNDLVLDNIPFIKREDIFKYADVLYSAKHTYMCLSGGSLLSSAINKTHTVLIEDTKPVLQELWKVPNINYVYLK